MDAEQHGLPGTPDVLPTSSDPILKSSIPPWLLILGLGILAGTLYQLSLANYLLYHTLLEFFFVGVAFTLFSIGWNARRFVGNSTFLILALAFGVAGIIQLLHLLSYMGMNIFPGIEANVATQLWIAARYVESVAFVLAAIALGAEKQLDANRLFLAALSICALILLSIWPLEIFPDCYVAGEGLTLFKVLSEYLVCALLLASLVLFVHRRRHLDRRTLYLLATAILFSVGAELAFTLYIDIYGFANFLGHFFKLLSVGFLYRALVIGTLRTPYATLFHDLNRAKEDLDRELIQRRQVEAELRATNRDLDAFVHTVSHDLRSPLTPIIGLSDYLQEQLEGKIDDEQMQSLRDISQQGHRMARILEDLLRFARVGRITSEDETADLDTILQRVLEDLGSQVAVSGNRVEIGPLPDVELPRTALFQVLSNLVSNAIKYAGKDGSPVEVTAGVKDDTIELSVRDHGPGVAEGMQERIFELFVRGEHEDIGGSGVGLATVHKIVDRLGGTLRHEQTPGGGATFLVTIPRQV